jgi:hypothetical protein
MGNGGNGRGNAREQASRPPVKKIAVPRKTYSVRSDKGDGEEPALALKNSFLPKF